MVWQADRLTATGLARILYAVPGYRAKLRLTSLRQYFHLGPHFHGGLSHPDELSSVYRDAASRHAVLNHLPKRTESIRGHPHAPVDEQPR